MKAREIKFRAWDGEKMIYPPDGYMFESTVIGNDFPGGITVNRVGRKTISLMQYTGFKDRNKTDIYEGDVIRSSTEDGKTVLHEIVFHNGAFKAESIYYIISRPVDYWCLWEIVGNRFEHPELLSPTAPQEAKD